MKELKADIKNKSFKRFYLLYGEDSALLNLYKNSLVKAMFPEADEFNLTEFQDKKIDFSEVKGISETLPFFAERRLVVIIKSDWFSKASELGDYIENAPETTYFLFVEEKVDKRNKLYKYVAANGHVCELKIDNRDDMLSVVGQALKKANLSITRDDAEYFLDKVGLNYARVTTELEKLTAYCADASVVDKEAIDTVCFEQPENKIFNMLDFIMNGQADRALKLYYDMLLLHEKPNNILFMLTRSYMQLYQVLNLNNEGLSKAEIARKMAIRDFIVDKYIRLNRRYNVNVLKSIVNEGLELEHKLKRGDIDKNIAVEMFILKYCH